MTDAPFARDGGTNHFRMDRPSFEGLEPRLLLDSDPTFGTALADSYVVTPGSSFTIGIDGEDADGQELTIGAVIPPESADVLSASTPYDTDFASLFATLHFVDSDGAPIGDDGDIRVQLIQGHDGESQAAVERFYTLATRHIEDDGTPVLAGDPFYTHVPVHRIIDQFMIQTGDPVNGDGTGGSPMGTFPDTFDDRLTFRGRGALAMANSGPDTNNSQFFITEVPTTWLNGDHMIFGQIISGWDVLEELTLTPTNASNRPLDMVYFEYADIEEVAAPQDGALTFTAEAGFSGSVDVDITLTDTDGSTVQKTITITADDELGDRPTIDVPATSVTVFPGASDTITATVTDDQGLDTDVWIEVQDSALLGSVVQWDDGTNTITLDIPADFATSEFAVKLYAKEAGYDNLTPRSVIINVSAAGEEPQIDVVNHLTATPGQTLTFTPTITDDGPRSLAVGVQTNDDAITASIDPATHEVTVDVPADYTGLFSVTVLAAEDGFDDRTPSRGVFDVISAEDYEAPALGVVQPSGSAQTLSTTQVGDILYVANGNRGLQIFDVSTPDAPVLLGSQSVGDEAWDVVIYETTRSGSPATVAFVADLTAGVLVLDVTDPSSIEEIDQLASGDATVRIDIAGDVLYQADFTAGLQTYDISNVDAIAGPLDTLDRIYLGDDAAGDPQYHEIQYAVAVEIDDDIVYLVDAGGYFYTLDPADPSDLGFYAGFNTTGRPWDIQVQDDSAYVLDEYVGLLVVDVSNPANPTLIDYEGDVTSMAWTRLLVSGNLAVVGAEDGFTLWDVWDPSAILQRSTFQGPSWGGGASIANGRLAMPFGVGGVALLDGTDLVDSIRIDGRRSFDRDGVTVTVMVPGAAGRVWLDTVDAGVIERLDIFATSRWSSVTVLSRGGDAAITDVHLYDDLFGFNARTTDLLGDFVADGLIGMLILDDVADDHTIDLAGGVAEGDVGLSTVTITLDLVQDTNLNTHFLPIRSLTVSRWIDGDDVDSSAGTIATPYLGMLNVRGNIRAGAAGDFAADVTLSGADRTGTSIASANVTGEVDGTWDLSGANVGNVRNFRAGSTAATWSFDAPNSVMTMLYVTADLAAALLSAKNFGTIMTRGDLSANIVTAEANARTGQGIGMLYCGSIRDIALNVAGGLGTLFATEWVDGADGDTDAGSLSAEWINSLRIGGNRLAGLDGDFHADVTLTGAGRTGDSLLSAFIAGEVDGDWDLTAAGAGGVRSFRAGSTAATWSFDAPNSVMTMLYVTADLAAALLSAKNFGTIMTRGDLSANIVTAEANARTGQGIGMLYCGSIRDIALNVAGGLGTLFATEWVDGADGDTDAGSLSAEWINSLRIGGNRLAGLDGDFHADVTLTGAGRTGDSLLSAFIAGEVDGDWDLTAAGAGGVRSFRAGSTADTWSFDAPNSLVSMLFVTGDLAGTQLSADRFGTIMTRGNVTTPITATGFDARTGVSINMLYAMGGALDCDLTAEGGVNTVFVQRWVDGDDGDALAGQFHAGWVGSLNVRGNAWLGVSGDFAAPTVLDNAHVPAFRKALTSAYVTGTLGTPTADVTIQGDAGSLIFGTLGGKVDIQGDLQIGRATATGLGIAPDVPGDPVYLQVAGSGTVLSGRSRFVLDNGRLYANDDYATEGALRYYNSNGAWWQYDAQYRAGAASGEDTHTTSVTDVTGDDYVTETTDHGDGTKSLTVRWQTAAEGDVTVTGKRFGFSPTEFVDMTFDEAMLYLPEEIAIGDRVVDQGDFTGTFAFEGNDGLVEGTCTGSARGTSYVSRYEQVVTPAGTFLALRVDTTFTVLGGRVTSDGGTDGVFGLSARRSEWLVPGRGVVKTTNFRSVFASVPGEGFTAQTATSTETLRAYDLNAD